MIRYGNFFRLVAPVEGGHASVAFDPVAHAQGVLRTIQEHLA